MVAHGHTGGLVVCQTILVQEAVDTLIDNGIHGQPMTNSHNRPYKSFSKVIEGKERRFCENLLRKQVNYSVFRYCRGAFSPTASMWITLGNGNRAFSSICYSRFNWAAPRIKLLQLVIPRRKRKSSLIS